MNNFRKSRGFGFYFRYFLCITLSICMVLTGLPVKSQAESPIEIKIDTLQKLKAITSSLEKIAGLIKDFEIFTPNMREKIVDTLQELKAIISTLEKIMSLLEEFKTITSPVERIMSALEELKIITPTLENTTSILEKLWTVIPSHGKSLENVMDTLKEFKTIKPTLEKIINNLEELKTNRTDVIPPDLEGKIRSNLAALRVTMLSLDRKIWNNLAQISSEMSRPAPTATVKPAPTPEPTQPPPAPVSNSGMGVGGVVLLVGGVVGAVAFLAAAAGVGKKETTSTSGGGGGGGSSGCSSGYFSCASKCCSSSSSCCEYGGKFYGCCPSGYPLYCNGKCYKTAGSSPCSISGEIVCYGAKVSGIGKIPANLNYNALKLTGTGLTLFNSNLLAGSSFFKTEFGVLATCSGNDNMLTTSLGLQVKGEYSRLRGQFIFSPFIQLQNQRSGSLTEFAENNVSVYTTTLYGMDILYVPYNLTLSSMIRQAIKQEDSDTLNAAAVQLTLKY